MKYLTLKSDVVIYTDASKSAGVIDETKDAATGTVVSAKFLKLIEQSFLSDSPEALSADAEKLLGDFMSTHSSLGISDSAASMGSKEESSVEDGSSSINNINVQEPKGKKTVRKIGNNTLYYYVADMNLKGSITTSGSDLGAVRIAESGPQLVAESSGCGACGVCGSCGVCAVCGEINAYSGAAAVTAAVAVVNLGEERMYAFDPAKRHETNRVRKVYNDEFTRQIEQLSALLK